jgi:hypothetical protein
MTGTHPDDHPSFYNSAVPQYIATDKFFEGMHITAFSFITKLLYKFF